MQSQSIFVHYIKSTADQTAFCNNYVFATATTTTTTTWATKQLLNVLSKNCWTTFNKPTNWQNQPKTTTTTTATQNCIGNTTENCKEREREKINKTELNWALEWTKTDKVRSQRQWKLANEVNTTNRGEKNQEIRLKDTLYFPFFLAVYWCTNIWFF